MSTAPSIAQEPQVERRNSLEKVAEFDGFLPVSVVTIVQPCYLKSIEKAVIKDLCVNDAFIDMDSAAMHKRADMIILTLLEEIKGSTSQRYTLHDTLVQKL
ncbi:unnamed protein product, partial [Rhizopus stolonifer]